MASRRRPVAITLAAAAEGDLDALVAIRIEAMRESLERIGRFDPVRARERLTLGFSSAHTRHIVDEGERVGLVVAMALPLRGGALRDSAANRFYVRHGFRLVGRGEFDNDYVRSPASPPGS